MHPRRASTRTTRGITGLILWILLTAVFCTLPHAGSDSQRQQAPPFALPNLLGEERSLSEYAGKVVLLNFWATWCPACIHEMPSLQTLYHSLQDKGFVVLAVASDVAGGRTVRPVVDRMGLTFPILLDPRSRITNAYMVRVRPTTYLIDHRGFLVSRIVGPRDWTGDEERSLIQNLLSAATDH